MCPIPNSAKWWQAQWCLAECLQWSLMGYNAILVVVDWLSKHIHAIPTVTSLDLEGVAQLFLEHIWHHHGLPEEVISDWGSAFVSNFSKGLASLLRVKLTLSTAYPQMDGQTECINQEIETYLWVFINHCQDDWADWLPLAEFAYNNWIHSVSEHVQTDRLWWISARWLRDDPY